MLVKMWGKKKKKEALLCPAWQEFKLIKSSGNTGSLKMHVPLDPTWNKKIIRRVNTSFFLPTPIYDTLFMKEVGTTYVSTIKEQLNKLGCFYVTAYPQSLKIMTQKNIQRQGKCS